MSEGDKPMKNKITDLNNHLFAQLERLSDEKLKGEKLTEEIKRSEAVTDVARSIIAGGELTVKAAVAMSTKIDQSIQLPNMLGIKDKTGDA